MNNRTHTWIALGVLAFFGLIFLLVLEFEHINAYLRRAAFFRTAAFAGGALAVGAAALAQWRVGGGTEQRVSTALGAGLVVLLLTPWLLSLTNRLFTGLAQPTTVEFVEEQGRYGSRFGQAKDEFSGANHFLLFFYHDEHLYKTIDDQPRFPQAEPGEMITIPLREGRWGFDWVAW